MGVRIGKADGGGKAACSATGVRDTDIGWHISFFLCFLSFVGTGERMDGVTGLWFARDRRPA